MDDNFYLQRCLELATRGGSNVYPNPHVGSVIVYNGKVIGEGFHPKIGGPHAEVMAIAQAKSTGLLDKATLYVNLEPCNHVGLTPPCTNLILENKIPKVVVGCLDPNPQVAGKGVARLRENGIEVVLAEDPGPFVQLNRFFFVNQQLGRPYITLKYAVSQDGFIGGLDDLGNPQPAAISGFAAHTFVHALRSHHHAIMVGRRTAAIDNPRLSNRLYHGENPIRIVLDRDLKLTPDLNLFDNSLPTLCLNQIKEESGDNIKFIKYIPWLGLSDLLRSLFVDHRIGSVLVEGGANLLQQLLDQNLFDQLIVIQGSLFLGKGTEAPKLPNAMSFNFQKAMNTDKVLVFDNKNY